MYELIKALEEMIKEWELKDNFLPGIDLSDSERALYFAAKESLPDLKRQVG